MAKKSRLAIRDTVGEGKIHSSVLHPDVMRSFTPIKDWITQTNWGVFWRNTEPVYPDLVEEFYRNMRQDEGNIDVLLTTVQNIRIKVDVQTLSDVLSLNPEGTKLREGTDAQNIVEYEPLMPEVEGNELIAACLPKEARICHYLVVNLIMPKSGSEKSVCKKERCVIWHILANKKLNLPVLIISHMKKSTATLPYGSIITKLLKWHGVEISGTARKVEASVIVSETLKDLEHSKSLHNKKRKASVAEEEVHDQLGKKVKVGSESGPNCMQHPKVVRKRSTAGKKVVVKVMARASKTEDSDTQSSTNDELAAIQGSTKHGRSKYTSHDSRSIGQSTQVHDEHHESRGGRRNQLKFQIRRMQEFGDDGEAICEWKACEVDVQQVISVQSKSLEKIEDVHDKVAETEQVIPQDPHVEADFSVANADPKMRTNVMSTEPLPTFPSSAQTLSHTLHSSTETRPISDIKAYMNQELVNIKACLQNHMDFTFRHNHNTCTHQLGSIERHLSELSVKMGRVTRDFCEKDELFSRKPAVSKMDAMFEMVSTLTSNSVDEEGICKMAMLIEMVGNLRRRVARLEGTFASQGYQSHATELENSKFDQLFDMMTTVIKDWMDTEEESQKIRNSVDRLCARVADLETRRNQYLSAKTCLWNSIRHNRGQFHVPSNMELRPVMQSSEILDIVRQPMHEVLSTTSAVLDEIDWADAQIVDPYFNGEVAAASSVSQLNA